MIHPEAALSLTAEGARYMDYPGADITRECVSEKRKHQNCRANGSIL